MPKSEWGIWIRCNILEIIILILVLILVINTFSKEPAKLEKTEPIIEEQAQPEQISEDVEKPSEQATPTEQIQQEQIPQIQ